MTSPFAVIDIGSNSVRLVVYDGLKRNPTALFNEKVLCGLARDLAKTGKLNEIGVKQAESAIARFLKLCDVMKANSLKIFATSAVRDASDGEEFVARLEKKYNHKILLLSEIEEAKYASCGVIASISDVSGVVGDLGGGSLELASVENNKINHTDSFVLGPLRIFSKKHNRKDYLKIIDNELKKFIPLSKSKGENFYAVGGAFRNIAKIHMERESYPLSILHNYKIRAASLKDTLEVIARISVTTLEKISGISKKRFDALPLAALILSQIIEKGKFEHVIFSMSGVREGLLFDNLSDDDKQQDPLILGCQNLSTKFSGSVDYAHELFNWTKPLFKNESKRDEVLRLAACILSDISCYENVEYRGYLACNHILDSGLIGLQHVERVFLAIAVYYRYRESKKFTIDKNIRKLLSDKKLRKAKILGYAMRLARNLSCSEKGVIKHIPLRVRGDDKIELKFEKYGELRSSLVEKRLEQLEEVL